MLLQIDRAIFNALNGGAENGLLDWLMPRLTNAHKALWFIVLVLPLLLWILLKNGKRGRTLIFCSLLALGLGDFTSSRIGKNLIWRDRPCRLIATTGKMSIPDLHLLPGFASPPGYVATPARDCPGSSSFPSSHAANSMAFATVCWWFTRHRGRWFWFLIPLMVGWSRIYLGYHYPSDVLAGWVLGCILGILICRFLARPFLRELTAEEQESAERGTLDKAQIENSEK